MYIKKQNRMIFGILSLLAMILYFVPLGFDSSTHFTPYFGENGLESYWMTAYYGVAGSIAMVITIILMLAMCVAIYLYVKKDNGKIPLIITGVFFLWVLFIFFRAINFTKYSDGLFGSTWYYGPTYLALIEWIVCIGAIVIGWLGNKNRIDEREVKTVKIEGVVNTPSNADELGKYKDLLDKGVISQEEFDAKKKQILGL